jgi:excisionase family DNA binding protein
MRTYSTQEVAEFVGIHRVTLQKWLGAGKIRPSQPVPIKGRTLWRWTKADVAQLRKYKAVHYRKGRGRKKKGKKRA